MPIYSIAPLPALHESDAMRPLLCCRLAAQVARFTVLRLHVWGDGDGIDGDDVIGYTDALSGRHDECQVQNLVIAECYLRLIMLL